MVNQDLMKVLVAYEIYLVPAGLVREEDYFALTENDAISFCYGIAQSKFGYGSAKYNDQNIIIGNFDTGVQVFFARANTSLFIESLNLKVPLNAGEILLSKTNIKYQVKNSNDIISLIFGISFEEQFVGAGSNSYEVSCTIKDIYKIKVRANTPEEAIKIANSEPIHSWKHPDIIEDLHKNRVLVRMARWGDLSVLEIGGNKK